MNKWNVGIYIRLSQEDGDKEESNSVTNQRELINSYISEDKELNVYDYYIDDGWSGTNFDRPDFKRLIADVENNVINTIIVKDLSRFGRNYIEVGNYLEQIFPVNNIRFIAINDCIDSYKDPESINSIIVPFKNLMNDEYCRDISNKIILALNARKKNGEYMGSFPVYGYKKDPNDKYKLIIDDEAADVVRLIFKLFLEGKGRVTITKYLNDRGILNPTAYKQRVLKKNYVNASDFSKSGLWCDTTIGHILRNEMYKGTLIQGKKKMLNYKVHKLVDVPRENWIVVENNHEPIIEPEIFDKVQDIIGRDTRIKGDGTGEVSLFAGYIRCADCKRAMAKKQTSNKYKMYHYYVCNTYRKKSIGSCTKHTIRSDYLEQAVLEALKVQISLAIEMEKMIEKINKSEKRNLCNNNLEKQIYAKQNELEKIKKLKKSVYEDWKLENITKEEYTEYKNEYDRDINRIEENIKYLEEEKIKYKEQVLGNNGWIEKLKSKRNLTKLTRDIIIEFIDCIYIHENSDITIKFKFTDEYERMLEYVKINEEIAAQDLRAV